MIRTLYGLVDGEGHKILLHDFLDFYDRLLNGEELEIRQEPFLGPIEEIGFILDDPSTIEEITQRKVWKKQIFIMTLKLIDFKIETLSKAFIEFNFKSLPWKF